MEDDWINEGRPPHRSKSYENALPLDRREGRLVIDVSSCERKGTKGVAPDASAGPEVAWRERGSSDQVERRAEDLRWIRLHQGVNLFPTQPAFLSHPHSILHIPYSHDSLQIDCYIARCSCYDRGRGVSSTFDYTRPKSVPLCIRPPNQRTPHSLTHPPSFAISLLKLPPGPLFPF